MRAGKPAPVPDLLPSPKAIHTVLGGWCWKHAGKVAIGEASGKSQTASASQPFIHPSIYPQEGQDGLLSGVSMYVG